MVRRLIKYHRHLDSGRHPPLGSCPRRGDGFVWICHLGVRFFSVYLTQNVVSCHVISDFRRRLDAQETAAWARRGRSWFKVTSIPHTVSRGKRIFEIASKTEFLVLNIGSTSPFRRSENFSQLSLFVRIMGGAFWKTLRQATINALRSRCWWTRKLPNSERSATNITAGHNA